MIVPLPNCFSIWASAACRALAFSLLALALVTAVFMSDSWEWWSGFSSVFAFRLDA
jgi:hypothetical protein